MFIKYKDNAIINLDNVSNVFVDRKDNKVIFNMNYAVKVVTSNGSLSKTLTPDYVYWKFNDLDEILKVIDETLRRAKFIIPNNIYNRYVNPKCISSIKIDEPNKKVIFNLNSTVTHPVDASKIAQGEDIPLHKQQLTSDFVFIKFNNIDEFYEYCEQIEELYSVV